MEFRLTYEGPLYARQRDPISGQLDGGRDHKHTIRKRFHSQLRQLWEITPFLRTGKSSGPELGGYVKTTLPQFPNKDVLAKRFSLFGFNFVPLVTQDLHLFCGLEILFLRPDPPGEVLKSGDIDNRLKTLFDALRMPEQNENYSQRTALSDETPFYCLLEDDKLITKISVETDQLLERVAPQPDMNDARLVITVRLRPYELHFGNLPFGG